MNIHKFKLEQFDDSNALANIPLANISNCNICWGCARTLAGPCLLNFEVMFLKENWVTLHTHKFTLEQFDYANALANIWSSNVLGMRAHPLLDPTCWNWKWFVFERNKSLCTFINSNKTNLRTPTCSHTFQIANCCGVRGLFAGPNLLNFEVMFL